MRTASVYSVICCLCVLTCAAQPLLTPSGYPLPVHSKHGMVASSSAIASGAGVEVLKRGGNAVDAAIAVAMALAVTHPSAGNLGGGGFLLVRMADGTGAAIDYRETAPAGASRGMYPWAGWERCGGPVDDGSPGFGSSGYSGGDVACAIEVRKHAVERSVGTGSTFGEEGLSGELFAGAKPEAQSSRGVLEEGRRIFQRDGRFFEEGEVLKQPELASTLRRLQKKGPREFYNGKTAKLLVAEMEGHGGLITLDDLKSYEAVMREPIKGTYRGYDVISMPPPSSGGVALIEMLNILEGFPMASMGFNGAARYHLVIEAMRRAFADRAEFLGDPDFTRVPVPGLTSKSYASSLASTIDRSKATPSSAVGHGQPTAFESSETTHFTVVDSQGNAVVNTYTLNGSYGSGVVVKGAGFLLNNEMDDFSSKPGSPNMYGLIQGEANSVGPRKRPLSAMTPTFVVKDGKLLFALGSPGGPTIINSVLQVILNVADHGMNLQQAVNAPRIHHQWMPDVIRFEPFGLPEDARAALESMGHRFADSAGYMGDVEAIMIDWATGLRWGASDMRQPDAGVVGY